MPFTISVIVTIEDALHNLGDSDSTSEGSGADSLFLQDGMQAIAREAIADMVLVKEVVVEYTNSPDDFETLSELPVLLSRVRGSLQLSGQGRAAIAIGQLEQFISGELLEKHKPMSVSQLELLADAVCSIEYYLEESGEVHGEGHRVLGVAENSLDKLGYACPSQEQIPEPEPEPELEPEQDTEQKLEPEPEPELKPELEQEPEQTVYEQDELPLPSGQSGMIADATADKPEDSHAASMITDLQVIGVDAD